MKQRFITGYLNTSLNYNRDYNDIPYRYTTYIEHLKKPIQRHERHKNLLFSPNLEGVST